MKLSINPAKYEVLIGQYLRSILDISDGIKHRRSIFSLNTFLEPLANRADLDNCECRLQNINSIFTWRRIQCRRRCLTSLILCKVQIDKVNSYCFCY